MKFDYSQINSQIFETLAKKYLEQKYPDFQWEPTPLSGDGNKDIVCKYRVLNQEQEYWAEAKFTKSNKPHKLLKGQLDPTLVSALLSPKQVSLCFISNNQITESYYYRLKDFKIQTKIGIELVLQKEFEEWLSKNPKQLEDYGIKLLSMFEESKDEQIQICSATITDILNSNQYKSENFLLEGIIYYLYVIIDSANDYNHMVLDINSEFALPFRSKLLENPNDFCVRKGKMVYKFDLLPIKVGSTEIKLRLNNEQENMAYYSIGNITITPNITISLSYIQQEKSLHEISRYIRESSRHNFIVPIVGNGATGKTKLIEDLYCELDALENVLLLSFIGNDYLDSKTMIKILLFFNIGNVFDYEKNDILSQIDTTKDEEQKIYFKKLVNGFFEEPEECMKELSDKLTNSNVCLLYPSRSRVQQVLLLDDIHKGKSILSKMLEEFAKQFLRQENNQSIIFASREYYEDFMLDLSLLTKDWIKVYYLDGLSREDKLATICNYFTFDEDIKFDRTTDDLIVFSNILQAKLPTDENKIMDPISEKVEFIRSFESPDIVNMFQYKEKLNQLKSYHKILELIFLVNFGVDYAQLIELFSSNDIAYLINKKVIKRVGKKVFPYHDHYIKAYFENHTISDITVETIKKVYQKVDKHNEKYLYLSLLLKSGYHIYCQIEDEAHELEHYYFKVTDYYKAYTLAKIFETYTDVNEDLSIQELYDLMILAVSAGYFEKPNCVKKRYEQLILLAQRMTGIQEVQGIILRAKSEIINIDYWELDVLHLSETINMVLGQIPPLYSHSNKDTLCAYLNLLNRKMVVALLTENFSLAEKLFQDNLTEINRLEREEYVGYLYMDYAKGLYLCNPKTALDYMKQAQSIFNRLGTEHRRLLDCTCEVEYLRVLVKDTEDFLDLEFAAKALEKERYFEIYSKAKLKLAALKIVSDKKHNLKKDILRDLYLSEYVLEYPATGRLLLLQKMVKNAFWIYSNEPYKCVKLTVNEQKLIYSLGPCYQKIFFSNEKSGIKHSIQFGNDNVMSSTYILDSRIW